MDIFANLVILSVIAATPSQPLRESIQPQDYPGLALMDRRSGSVEYALTVSAEGVPIRCEVRQSSDSKQIDLQTCALLIRRTRFHPAVDSSGAASPAVFRGVVNWSVPSMRAPGPRKLSLVDMDLTIARIPAGIAAPATAEIAFAVDVEGRMSDCTPVVRQSNERRDEQRIADVLGPTACASARSILKPRPALDEQDRPIASIQTAEVKFSAGRSSKQ